MDKLFEVSFTPLAESGKAMSRWQPMQWQRASFSLFNT